MTLKTLDELGLDKDKIAIIHYASTSIYETPEITQIAVRDYGRGETRSFGHTTQANERDVLIAWGEYVNALRGYTFVGWNFHSSTYGIPAMEARWLANNITDPFPVNSADVVDLDELIGQKFGHGYMTGPEKLKRVSDLNGATTTGFVPGKDEPQLYGRKEFQRLMLSTERKVAMIAHLLGLALSGRLVVNKPEALITAEPKSKRPTVEASTTTGFDWQRSGGWLVTGLLSLIVLVFPEETRATIDTMLAFLGYPASELNLILVQSVFVIAFVFFSAIAISRVAKWRANQNKHRIILESYSNPNIGIGAPTGPEGFLKRLERSPGTPWFAFYFTSEFVMWIGVFVMEFCLRLAQLGLNPFLFPTLIITFALGLVLTATSAFVTAFNVYWDLIFKRWASVSRNSSSS